MNLIKDIKNYGRGKEAVGAWLSLAFALIVLGTLFIFAPWWLAALGTIALLAVGILLMRILTRFVRMKTDFSFAANELEAILNNLDDAVLIYDPNFKILKVNPAAEKLFGLKSGEIVGQYLSPETVKNRKLQKITQVVFPTLAPAMTQLSGSGEWPQITAVSLENPNLGLRTSLHRFENKRENYVIFLKTIKDLTREKEIMKSKSDFVSTAAHQLRTPLTAVKWALEGLKESNNLPAETKNTVEGALSTIERAVKVTNDFLDVTKIEEGKFNYSFDDVNLTVAAKELIETVSPIAKKHSIRVYFSHPPGNVTIRGDASRLSTALLNILDNAVRYNVRGGTVTFTVERDEEKKIARLRVKDTGVGIPEEDRVGLFEKLHRGQNVLQIDPNGSGLGLFIAKNVIEKHGGKIGVESELGRGTTFEITLPLKD